MCNNFWLCSGQGRIFPPKTGDARYNKANNSKKEKIKKSKFIAEVKQEVSKWVLFGAQTTPSLFLGLIFA